MANMESGGGEWQERRMGKKNPVLPERSRVRRVQLDTRTHVEYGEKTWTTGQTVRDVLQNHLDAHTQDFFEEIVAKVIDTEQLAKKELSEKEVKEFDDFTYRLYLYRLGLGDRTPEAEQDMVKSLNSYAWMLPIRRELLGPDKRLSGTQLQKILAPIHEHPVALSFKVYDQSNTEDKGQWVSRETLTSHLGYQEQLTPITDPDEIDWGGSYKKKTKPNYRYKISGIDIEDTGSGFDNTLTAFYKSTKTGKRHLRGKFGEGDKMSRTHLVRHGATARSRSRYFISSGQNKERWWQHRPYLDPEDKKVKLKGAEVEMPKTGEARFGSSTRIETQKADQNFATDFGNQVDPRIKDGGLSANCLEFSAAKYYYPAVDIGHNPHPVGVSIEASPELQYVQGLRVGEDATSRDNFSRMLFSYNFLDSSLLKGRDRNQLGEGSGYYISEFWQHAESRELLTEFIKRAYINDPPDSMGHRYFIESDVSTKILKEKRSFDEAQTARVREMYLELFPKVLGIEAGKKYVVVTKEEHNQAERKLWPLLEKHGYTILIVQNKIPGTDLSTIATHYQNTFELHTFEDVKKTMEQWDLTEGIRPELMEAFRPVFDNALQDFRNLLIRLGIKDVKLDASPIFAACIDPDKEQAVEAEYSTQSGTFRIKIKPEAVFTYKVGRFDSSYWQDRIVVEMMTAVGRTEGFRERMSALQQSQDVAQMLLDKSTQGNPDETKRLLASFRYKEGEERKYQNEFFEKLKNVQENLQGWEALEKARNLKLTLAEMQNLADISPMLPEDYKRAVERILNRSIVIENGIVGFCNESGEAFSRTYEFQSIPLAQLEVVGEINGQKLYRLGATNDRVFILQALPDGTVVHEKEERNVVFGGKILTFQEKFLKFYDPFGYGGINLNGECLSMHSWHKPEKMLTTEDRQKLIKQFEEELKKRRIAFPENGQLKPMRNLRGTVETPLSIDYGKDEWNNPVRVFQDIVQNHLDADPNRQAVLQFEVVRMDQRIWVSKEEISQADKIVGFAVVDNGSGYAPDDLGTMGKSSKKSPLFAGKYGEGQKMVAAAAARKGFDLRFSSTASYEGKQYRWVGAVGSESQEIIISGTPKQEQRVVFNVSSQEAVADGMTSMTAIRLPDDPSRYEDPEWQKWVEIIDPRIKDEHGNEGLSRYIINLREQSRDKIIDMGYIRIMLDEPGAVYENGLLVQQRKDLMFGYDVPEVVSTRERNSVSEDKLRGYIGHAFAHCPDPRLAMNLIRAFKENYLANGLKNFKNHTIKEQDLQFWRMGLGYGELDSKPYWDLASTQQLPGVLVTSKDHIQQQIGFIVENFQKSDSHGINSSKLTRLQMTLANLAHIPEDQLLDVPIQQYEALAKILPSAERYTLSLAEQEVDVGGEVENRLLNLVFERAQNLANFLTSISDTPEYTKLIAGTHEQPNTDTANSYQKRVAEQLELWGDPELLSGSPSMVFVAPASAGYLGTVRKDRLGINETLFTPQHISKLAGTIDHELIHKIVDLGDYTPEFIIALLRLAKYNFESAV